MFNVNMFSALNFYMIQFSEQILSSYYVLYSIYEKIYQCTQLINIYHTKCIDYKLSTHYLTSNDLKYIAGKMLAIRLHACI